MSLYVKGLQDCGQSKFSRLYDLKFYVRLWKGLIHTDGHPKAQGCARGFGVL